MTVKEIIENWLVNWGYDGLFDEDCDCACLVGDLQPCDGGMMNCQAGYKIPCPPDCGGHDYHIAAEREQNGKTKS